MFSVSAEMKANMAQRRGKCMRQRYARKSGRHDSAQISHDKTHDKTRDRTQNYSPSARAIVEPKSAGLSATAIPQAFSASIFACAVSSAPPMIAPA